MDEDWRKERVVFLQDKWKKKAEKKHSQDHDDIFDPWILWWMNSCHNISQRQQFLSWPALWHALLGKFGEAKQRGMIEWLERSVADVNKLRELAIFELFREHLDSRRYHDINTLGTPTWMYILSKHSHY